MRDDTEGLRHLAILALMYDSGCRVQELIELNVSDFSCSGKCYRIHVRGKGNKFRMIPIPPETGAILEKYITQVKLTAGDALFNNKKGKGSPAKVSVTS